MSLRSRPRDEGGASAVEAAIVSLLLFTLLFGIIEMSLLMRDAGATSSAARAGTRAAAAAAAAGPCSTAPAPQCLPAVAPLLGQVAADAVGRALNGVPDDDVEWLMVYEAGTNGYPVGKSTYTCGDRCVTYKPLGGAMKYVSGSWDTKARVNACVNDPARTAVGVALRVRHGSVTGLFGAGIGMTERSVMYFEPLPNDACKPGAHG